MLPSCIFDKVSTKTSEPCSQNASRNIPGSIATDQWPSSESAELIDEQVDRQLKVGTRGEIHTSTCSRSGKSVSRASRPGISWVLLTEDPGHRTAWAPYVARARQARPVLVGLEIADPGIAMFKVYSLSPMFSDQYQTGSPRLSCLSC
jgi:hypothetical protein